MSESGFVEESPAPGEGSSRDRRAGARRRHWLLPTVLAFALLVLPALAAWVYLGRVYADDVRAYEELADQFVLVDRRLGPLSHGNLPPCEAAHEGTVTRSYSRETGPTALELRGALLELGWTEAPATPPAVFRLELASQTPDHELSVRIEADSPNSFGVSLTATSTASTLACFVRG